MPSLHSKGHTTNAGPRPIVGRYTVPTVAALALLYALFAGLRTVGDSDIGWCLATGRWIVQHHSIPSTDVLSYTARGQEWIYPALSQVLLYSSFLLGNYSLLSWLGAAACVGTVAILLRRGHATVAVLAVLAVPMIAERTNPRAEMFTEVLFAGFVSLLWHYHRSGRGPVWALPALMLLWVNLHLGFIAGLGMCAAYVFLELSDAIVRSHRVAALERLRRAAPWLLLTGLSTFLNPWGPRIYVALSRQQGLNRIHSRWIYEWMPIRLTPSTLTRAFAWRDPDTAVLWLLAAGVLAALLAVCMRRIASAVLLGTSIYLVIHANRFEGPFAPIAVIIGGSIIADAFVEIEWMRQIRQRFALAATAAVLAMVFFLVAMRVGDLVTNRYYLRETAAVSLFGAGESFWFPERAAAFLSREHLPPNIFNDYNSGGFLTWALPPEYGDYIDGRSVPFGANLFLHFEELLRTPLDSSVWQQEADQRNINTVIVSLDHVIGIGALPSLEASCRSQQWRPVYLDSQAAVFVRVRTDTADLVRRLQLDCDTVCFDSPPASRGLRGRAERFQYYLNAASILIMLDRTRDAMEALERAEGIFSDNPFLHYAKGVVLQNLGHLDQAEQELLISVELGSDDASLALARYYHQQRRYVDETRILAHAVETSTSPALLYVDLGYAQLAMGMPDKALISFDQAERESPFDEATAGGADFQERIAQGRAEAHRSLRLK